MIETCNACKLILNLSTYSICHGFWLSHLINWSRIVLPVYNSCCVCYINRKGCQIMKTLEDERWCKMRFSCGLVLLEECLTLFSVTQLSPQTGPFSLCSSSVMQSLILIIIRKWQDQPREYLHVCTNKYLQEDLMELN